MKLVIHAPNVHRGGGASLLVALLRAPPSGMQVCVTIDERFPLPADLSSDVVVRRFPSTLAGRIRAESQLRALAQPGDAVLCFGNLPPLFRLRGTAVLFIQNLHLVDSVPSGFTWRMKLRLLVEQTWLRSRLANVQRVVVQTPTMQRFVQERLGVKVDVVPFSAAVAAAVGTRAAGARYDFIYVSSGESHKNHAKLLEAWTLLARDGIRPHLGLTLSTERDAALCRRVGEACAEYGMHISNIGTVAFDHVQELYARADAFVFPSVGESFGLPLLEAAAAKLPIIAAESDYVRDVVDPVYDFDPNSAISIARAIKRYLGAPDCRILPVTPGDFLRDIVRRAGLDRGPVRRPGALQDGATHTSRAS